MINSAKALRAEFWREHPKLSRKLIRDHSGNGYMYTTDARCAFSEFVDYMHRDGRITDRMADQATLETPLPRNRKSSLDI